MDRISPLLDSLLLRILSFLPTEDVAATMVLSKRWQPLWMMVPKLVYDDRSYEDTDYGMFLDFVDKSLLLHKAPLLETLHFRVSQTCGVGEIPLWSRAAVKRSVRELVINFDSSSSESPSFLPRSIYTGCTMLVTLSLNNVILVDVASPMFFTSLKSLKLISVKYPGENFVKKFLSNCIVLEELRVEQCAGDNVSIFTIRVPSLERLLVHKIPDEVTNDADGFVIFAPSLKCLDIFDSVGGFCVIENEMPSIAVANIAVSYKCVSKILGSITSVKRLHLCLLHSKDVNPLGTVFHRLLHLKICTCEPEWLNILMCLLRNSPKLILLKIEQGHTVTEGLHPCWNEPSSIPECLLSSLETLKWVNYEGREEEKQVAAFILRNGSCLKKVSFSSTSTTCDKKKLELLKELSFLPRSSPTCHLTFD